MQYFNSFNIFNEAYESRGLEDMLRNKAQSFKEQGVTFHILRQVYSRGIETFNEKGYKGSSKNYAMKRVNDFLAHGKSWSIYDTDLADKVRKNKKSKKSKKK